MLSIIIPVRDEAPNLEPLVTEVEALREGAGRAIEVIIVDDGSRDGSWDITRQLAAERPWLRALRFRAGRGQTAAMAAGIQASRGEFITFLDADLQNDPNDIPRLLAPIVANEADVVCGWRRSRKDHPVSRGLPSIVANFLIRTILSLRIHDVGCTLKVFRREYVESVHILGEMHRFLAAYAQAQGARMMEMEVNHRPRAHGSSKYGFSRVGKVLVDLLTVVMLNSYGASPAYFFGKIAAFFFLLGTIAFSIVAWRTFALDRPESTPMIFMMLLMYMTSLFALMCGLLAELNIRVLYQVGIRKPYEIRDVVGFAEDEKRS